MDNQDSELFEEIFDNISENALGQSLALARSFVNSHPLMVYDGALEDIEKDYALMLGYMSRGYVDPQRENVYESLVNRLYNFVSDMYLAWKKRNIGFFTEASRKSLGRPFPNEDVRQALESFVTDQAMISLEPEDKAAPRLRKVHAEHNRYMQALFSHIAVSGQWSEGDAEFYTETLLSPLVDSVDACLITGALTLAVMNNMDINKFTVLMRVYLGARDEGLRQRALIGWVFSLSSDMRIHARFERLVLDAVSDPKVVAELADLQKQILFCVDAERDNDRIRRDIIPGLMQDGKLGMARLGITEEDEDPMADVFDPGESDRAMERMEESFQKMMDMHREGSDIYFGGFSQMKNFPFFFSVANWFCPFYTDHPGIAAAREKLKGTSLLENIRKHGPFCDSDKYSFTLAISSLMSRLPDSLREMFNSREALGATLSQQERNSPTYIRRTILQDMYRFFRLHPQREQLVNPFDSENFMFVTDEIFEGTDMASILPEICFFALKHHNGEALAVLVNKYCDETDPKSLYINGVYSLKFDNDPYTASRYLSALADLEPENKRALSLLARCYFECEDYEAAAECYEDLCEMDPGDGAAALNHCVALSKARMYDEAINLLYKLDLETPGSTRVVRVLAWTLMGMGKMDQAEREYRRLLSGDETEPVDWLNAGYCQWFMGNVSNAVERFRNFLMMGRKEDQENCDISQEFLKDYDFITDHGISPVDCHLMADLVNRGDRG